MDCPKAQRKECGIFCAARGGVKTCKVTKGKRAIIKDGYPTHEIYTVPGSMNCVCNDPDPDAGGNLSCGDDCKKIGL